MMLLRWLGWRRQSRPSITWEPTRPVSQVTDGRRRLIEQPYALPKDSQEEQRLTFQHDVALGRDCVIWPYSFKALSLLD
jgi:hypothetical protein